MVARIALYDADVWQFPAVGLADIEHIRGAKSHDMWCMILVVFIFFFGLATNHWGENQDAFLSLLDAPAQLSLICSDFISVFLCGDLVPSLEAGEPKDRVARRTEEVKSRSRSKRQPA